MNKVHSHKSRHSQNGMGLATAIFVITVMAILAVIILQLVRNNSQATGEEVELIRSFYTAESGVQMMLNSVFPPSGAAAICPATKTYNMTVGGVNACSAVVTCAVLIPPLTTDKYYTITSTGTCGAVNRTIQVRAQ